MEKTERIKPGSVVRLKSGSPPMVVYKKHKLKPPKPAEGEKPEPPGPMYYCVAYFDNERNQIANLFPGLPAEAFELVKEGELVSIGNGLHVAWSTTCGGGVIGEPLSAVPHE